VDRLLRKIDATDSADRKYASSRKCMARMCEDIDTIEKLVISQKDTSAPEIHRTMRHFECRNGIIMNLTFPNWKLLFFIPVFNDLCFRNCTANVVEICHILPIIW